MPRRPWRLRLPRWVIAGWGVFATLLTVLSLPSVPGDIAKWGPVLSGVDAEPIRWVLPALGWILLAALVSGMWSGWLRPGRRRGHIEIGEIKSRTVVRGPVSVASAQSSDSHREQFFGANMRRLLREMRHREAERQIEEELVALVDEWRLVRGDDFGETDYGTFALWTDRTSAFIRKVFGEAERQRFESHGSEAVSTLRQGADLRIRALEHLRDRPESWRIQLDGQELEDAIAARRRLAPQDRIVIAGTPLSRHYEDAARDSSLAVHGDA